MATPQDHISMALFCDFENVALGVRDAKYDKFDIKRVLERLLLKGSIVVKKAYCDWDRYKGFKAIMHEANFELIEIPHVRQSGKNSADIRLVVDALDLCYTKSHVNTFVIISGDSDFSPLVSKLRENAKHVIGVGVKQSTSDLLIANCDEFIFYDDLVREGQRMAARRDDAREAQPQPRRSPEEERQRRDTMEARRSKAVELAAETFDAMVAERGDSKIWASVLKEAIKRRNPGFSEAYFGFKTFGNLLEEAQARGLLEFGRDEKSGAYVFRSSGGSAPKAEAMAQSERAPQSEGVSRHSFHPPVAPAVASVQAPVADEGDRHDGRRKNSRGGRGGRPSSRQSQEQVATPPGINEAAALTAVQTPAEPPAPSRGAARNPSKPTAAPASRGASAPPAPPSTETSPAVSHAPALDSDPPAPKRKAPARKAATSRSGDEAPATRSRRPAKKAAAGAA